MFHFIVKAECFQIFANFQSEPCSFEILQSLNLKACESSVCAFSMQSRRCTPFHILDIHFSLKDVWI